MSDPMSAYWGSWDTPAAPATGVDTWKMPSNPIDFIAGFWKNTLLTPVRILQGASALVTMLGHDVVGGIQEFIPGEQQIESEGSHLKKVVLNLPKMLFEDYTGRYGGFTNIIKTLYNDPASIALDALMVGAAVKGIALAGRGSGIMYHMPRMVSEETAVKILGGGAATDYRGIEMVANSYRGSAAQFEKFQYSRNPVTRALQKKSVEALTMPPTTFAEKVIPTLDPGMAARGEIAARLAAERGVRMLRPRVGEYVTGHIVSTMLGSRNLRASSMSREALDKIDNMIKGKDKEAVAAYMMGEAYPPGLANYGPIRVQNLPDVFDNLDPPSPLSMDETFAKQLHDLVGEGNWEYVNIETPHSRASFEVMKEVAEEGEVFYNRQTYGVLVNSLDEVADMDTKIVQRLGLTDVKRRNYFHTDELYDAYHLQGVTSKGARVDISIGTREGLAAQQNYGFLAEHLRVINSMLEDEKLKMADELMELASVHGEDMTFPMLVQIGKDLVAEGVEQSSWYPVVSKVSKMNDTIKNLTRERIATQALMDDMMAGQRVGYWSEHGFRIPQELIDAENIRAVSFKEITDMWWPNPEKLPATTYLEHSYLYDRVNMFMKWEGKLLDDIEYSLRATDSQQDMRVAIGGMLAEQTDLPSPIIDLVMGLSERFVTKTGEGALSWGEVTGLPGIPLFGGSQAGRTREVLGRRFEKYVRPLVIEEGGRGSELNWPKYDFLHMRAMRQRSNLPLPSYFPAFPKGDARHYGAVKGGMFPRTPGSAQMSRGILYQEQKLVRDPVEALSRQAAVWRYHTEAQRTLEDIVVNTGREMKQGDLLAFHAGDKGGEVLVPIDGIKSGLSLRGAILDDTLKGLSQHGYTFQEAVLKAINDLMGEIKEGALNNIDIGRVYAVPRVVMKKFQKELRYAFDNPALTIYYDGMMGLWKSSVLSMQTRWVVNNFFGNNFFVGMEEPGALRLAIGQWNKKDAYLIEQMLRPVGLKAAERGFWPEHARYFSRIPKDADAWDLKLINRIKESRVGEALSSWNRMVREFNTRLEQAYRRGVFLNATQKSHMKDWVQGYHSGTKILERAMAQGDMDVHKLDAALKAVDRTLGNYTMFTVGEQQILKRFLVPFWGFYRHAAKFAARMPFKHPLKAKVLEQLATMDEEMNPLMPEWMRTRIPISHIGGEDLLVNLRNINPLNQFTEQAPLMSILNPIPKLLIERTLGVDTYTNEPFPLPENMFETWSGDVFELVRDEGGNVTGVKKVDGKPAPSLLKHIASQFPQLSLFPGFQRYPKSTLLSIASLIGLPLSRADMEAIESKELQTLQAATTTALNIGEAETAEEEIPDDYWGGW